MIAEDHHPEGGLGSAVTDALLAAGQRDLSVAHLAVREMPGSGTGPELLAWAGIDAGHIAAAARLRRQQMMSHHHRWPDRPEPTW